MWLYTIAKKYLEEEKVIDDKFKPRFKCPMIHGWIYGNANRRVATEFNFMTSIWNYVMKTGFSHPRRYKSYDNCYITKESSNQIKIIINNDCENFSRSTSSIESVIFKLMDKYKISNIKLYPDSTILTYKEKSINSIPKKVLNEIDELTKFNSFFNCDLISIDINEKYLSTTFLLNTIKFTSKSNHFLTDNQSFTNMINTFPNYELYVKMIKVYSNPQEYIKSILIPLIFNHKFDKIDYKLIILNYDILKEFISMADSNKLKMLKFYIKIYNMAFDNDNIYKPFFEKNILTLLSEY